MRKTVLITLAALLALVSCTKEQSLPEEFVKGKVTFKASIVETKTFLGDKEGTSWPNYWSQGDVISVNGVASDPVDASFDGSAKAEFTVEGIAAPYNAAYPASAVSGYEAGSATITIPDEQIYVDGSYDPEAYVMLGKASGENLAFVPQMAIFSMTPTGTGAKIKSVSLTSLGGKKIAGAFTTDFEGLTAADGAVSTVTVSAIEGIDLGEPWMILIPASDFTEDGIKIVITADDNSVMTRTTKPSKAYAAGKMYSATIPFSPDPLSLEAVTASSSSLVFGWGRGSAAADGLSAYTVALYTEEACSNLVVSYALPAEAGVWQDADGNEREPRFVIGGLAPSTTYYCKVTDNTKNEVSDVVPATTLAFTPVDARTVSNASVGDVLLAEDFSEVGWGPDEFAEAAGFIPDHKNLEVISGPHSDADGDGDYVACKNTGNRLFGKGYVDLGNDKRLSTEWGYFGNSSVYIRNGYFRVSTTGGRTHIVTPALVGIPAGKFATIDVTVTAAKHEVNTNDIAVFVESGLTLSGDTEPTVESYRKYTGASLSDGHALGFTASREWETKTVRIANVTSEDQLLIGSLNNVSGLNRFSLSDIKVELVELSDAALMEAACIAASSSTLVFEWSNGGTAAEDVLFPYIIELYSDAECTEPVVSHVIEPGVDEETGEPKAHGCWNGKTPRFVFGSLDPGTTYYFRVINAGNGKTTAVIPGTTSAFTVVDATTVSNASVGDVILAEDFSEIGFGADQLKSAAGFIPTSKTLEPVIGEFSSEEGVYVVYNSTARRLYGDANVQQAYRLYDWGFFGNSAVYAFAGYLRVCTSDSGARTHIVSPALAGIPDGKLATIDVTVTSCKYESSTNDIAVFVEKASDLTLVLAPDQVESTSPKFSSQGGKYTGATLSDGYPLEAVNGDWSTKTVRIKNVTNANRLLFGSYQNVDKKNRFFLSDVKVEIVDLKEAGQIEEEMNIYDFSTLKTFLTKCADGLTMAGNVTASIALSDEEEADIASLYPVDFFDGVLNGGGFAISGLKKPLINRLAGSVSNLTLESEINITEAQNNVGIFVMEAVSPASFTNCVSKGSVTLDVEGGVNGNLFIGGMVGKISGGTMTDCVNDAPVTNATDSGDTTTGIISVGGITGYASSVTFSKCVNNKDVTNTGVAGSGDTYCRVGGLVGWAVASNLSASGENKNINYGDVTEESDSQDSAFAGVVAFADGEVSNLSNCRNEGDITFGGSKTYAFLGGIAGAFANSSVIDNTYNTGAITASGATMAMKGYMRCGGIVGGWFKAACTPQTITGCINEGSITFQPAGLGGEAGGGVDSYVGGIAGGGNNGGVCGKALINCKNSGAITMGSTGSVNSGKLYHRFCVGGIIGFTDVNPTGSKCIANIRFRSTSGTNRIGGIAGEMMVDEIHDVTYKGTVNSNGTSSTNYTGGLVGNVGTGEKTFRNCTLSGTMRGPNSEGPGAGIFFSCKGGGTGPTVNIASCKVGSGTRLQSAASGYVVTITTADQITAANVCGTNGSTRTCTAGTNDGLSVVVDPDTITL